MRREDRHLAHEDVAHLLAGLAHRGGRRDDLRLDHTFAELPAAQFVDGRLVQANHGAERPTDQMELVLDDEIRRSDRADILDLVALQPPACLMVAIAVRAWPEQAVALAFLAAPGRTASAPRPATPSSRTCRRWRSSSSGDGGRSPRPRRAPGCPGEGVLDLPFEKSQRPILSPQ